MLFNSYSFLLVFLPLTAVGFFLLARRSQFAAAVWMAAASIAFYGYWDVRYVPLLLGSIVLNYRAALRIRVAEGTRRKAWLAGAITADLLLLAYYKYAGFFLDTLSALTGHPMPVLSIVLPIGISFFTFTQIAFLVDTYQGKVGESRFIHYVLFVTYFPHLIAGPVLHHKEMMPQFADPANYRPRTEHFAAGLTIFFIGLAKKTLLADNIAPYANAVFKSPDGATLLVAWGGVLAYAFQLYFDFSGYSDMAIGLSRLFGVQLPLNFDSPYKSASITEFWRRWHMTLSRFLRDYLYIALGGNRHGNLRRYFNLMATMVLGGLWHGAGWNFAIWGALHGVYLTINYGFNALRLSLRGALWRACAVALTFVAVCYAWVFFRAADLHGALQLVRGMSGGSGISLPDAIGSRLGSGQALAERWGVQFYGGGGAQFIETWSWIVCAGVLAFAAPNTQQIMAGFTPRRRWAMATGVLGLLGVLALNRPSDFLYFQF